MRLDPQNHFALETHQECDIWGLAMLLKHIDEAKSSVKGWAEGEDRNEIVPAEGLTLFVTGNLAMAQHFAQKLMLQATHNRVWYGGGTFHLKSSHLTWAELFTELKVLRESIEADLEHHLFVQIAPPKASLVWEIKTNWEAIWAAFPDVKTDIEEAVYCYAFGRNTATIFHSMRVAEHGLRAISRKLKVRLTDKGMRIPVDCATWNKVIEQIRSKIKSEKLKPVGRVRALHLQHYSEAADHCEYMKDLWRNEISHAGKFYNEGEASGAINRVHDFMAFLSRGMKDEDERKRGV